MRFGCGCRPKDHCTLRALFGSWSTCYGDNELLRPTDGPPKDDVSNACGVNASGCRRASCCADHACSRGKVKQSVQFESCSVGFLQVKLPWLQHAKTINEMLINMRMRENKGGVLSAKKKDIALKQIFLGQKGMVECSYLQRFRRATYNIQRFVCS